MKKMLLTMLLVSMCSNAEELLNDQKKITTNDYYNVILENKTYSRYSKENKKNLIELKNNNLKDTQKNICAINYYYCTPNMRSTYVLEQLNGNLIEPEISQIVSSHNEIIFPVIHNLAIKHNELHKKYINKNDFENYFNSEYIPALRDFLTENSNNYIIWKTLHYNTVNLEDLLNNSLLYEKKKVSIEAAILYFSKGKSAKDLFIQEKTLELANKEKIKIIEFIEKRKTK